MNYKTLLITLLFLVHFKTISYSQILEAGFNKEEYKEMLLISPRNSDDPDFYKDIPEPENYTKMYQSKALGLDNSWSLWKHKNNKIAVISIRGTTQKTVSWLANFYMAMVPAKGEITYKTDSVFKYELAPNPKAGVHTGWLLSLAYLHTDIIKKMKTEYDNGIRNFIIMGHSQGGAITYLLNAYLKNLQDIGELSKDITLKTYCSAAPKPGNTYFAYYYEYINQGGWAFNVVNSADWVPESPISIQTLDDFNPINPFVNAESLIKKQKFPKNVVMHYMYNRLHNSAVKTQKIYEKYLGVKVSGIVEENLEGFVPPKYLKSNNYVRTGSIIILYADDDYFLKFSDKEDIFVHHLNNAYLYLLSKLK